eukprot:1018245-Amphidinium_carterae.1
MVVESWRLEVVNPDKSPPLPKYPDATEPQIIEEAASSAGPGLSPRPVSRQALVEKLQGRSNSLCLQASPGTGATSPGATTGATRSGCRRSRCGNHSADHHAVEEI